MKLVARGDTTVVDAYLSPVLRRYVDAVADGVARASTCASCSRTAGSRRRNAFTARTRSCRGRRAASSASCRPACARASTSVIGFDMGGTSTDVSHFAGDARRGSGAHVRHRGRGRARARADAGDPHRRGGRRLDRALRRRALPRRARVGGRQPGPGLLPPRRAADRHRLQRRARQAAARSLPARVWRGAATSRSTSRRRAPDSPRWPTSIAAATGERRAPEEIAAGFVDVAVANMANAIKRISVARGHDVTAYTLAVFGGAGGQHACLVADALGMTRVFAHPLAGVLSAYGMGLAGETVMRERALEVRLDGEALPRARARRWMRWRSEARAELQAQGIAARARSRSFAARTCATKAPTPRSSSPRRTRGDARRVRGRLPPSLLVPDGRARRSSSKRSRSRRSAPGEAPADVASASYAPRAGPLRAARRGAALQRGRVARGAALPPRRSARGRRHRRPGDHRRGEPDHGRRARLARRGRRRRPPVAGAHRAASPAARLPTPLGARPDPVRLELFNNLFMSIAEQMGLRLQNTAHSVNIKERLDFSCAIFDAAGRLIANAPHIPVHLGSMGESIQTVLAREPRADEAGRRVRAQRALPGRHAPARHHRGHAGLRRRGRARSCSFSGRAATTPTSAAPARARCPPTAATSTRKGCSSTTSR